MDLIKEVIYSNSIFNIQVLIISILILVLLLVLYYRNYLSYNFKLNKYLIILSIIIGIGCLFLVTGYFYNKAMYTNVINSKSFELSKDNKYVVIDKYNIGVVKPDVNNYQKMLKLLSKNYSSDKVIKQRYENLIDSKNKYVNDGDNIPQDTTVVTIGSDGKCYMSIAMEDSDKRTRYRLPIKLENGVILNGNIGTKIDKDSDENTITYKYNEEYDIYYDIKMGVKK